MTPFRTIAKADDKRGLFLIAVSTFGIVALVIVATVWLYIHSQTILREDLQEKLQTYAHLSSMQFTAEEVETIWGEEDMDSDLFHTLVTRAKHIRQSLPDVTYVYIMRRTEDPLQLAFVIEDDMLDSLEDLDENGDGILQPDEEAVVPGEPFDISDVPAMQKDAFEGPAVDLAITHDQWGSWMSGYAPIFNENGNTVAILGIDMSADRFIAATQQVFSPMALLLALLGITLIMGGFLYLLWRRRVRILEQIDRQRRSLITIASHKLGGPIATLRWWSELLQHPYEKQNTKEVEQEINSALDHLSQVVNDLDHATRTEVTEKELREMLARETAEELALHEKVT